MKLKYMPCFSQSTIEAEPEQWFSLKPNCDRQEKGVYRVLENKRPIFMLGIGFAMKHDKECFLSW